MNVMAMPSLRALRPTGRNIGLPVAPNAIETTGLGLVARPGEESTGVELTVSRMEAASHHAGGKTRDRQGSLSALHLACDRLVRHHENLAVTIREAKQRAGERFPGRVLAIHPEQLGR